jgi:RNA polymerase sigma-70 factor (ECF subfamily)
MTTPHFIPVCGEGIVVASILSLASGGERSLSAAPKSVPPQEAELIRRILAGEKALFYELVQPYERAVFVAAMSVVHNQQDAEDVAQEAVLKAFVNLKSFRAESKFSTWLIQITINEARMKLRKDHAYLYESTDEPRTDDQGGDYLPKDWADWRDIPSETLQREELRTALSKAIDDLDQKYREVLILRDVEGLSIAETAKALNITEANVKTRLLRARLQVRDALAPGIDGSWTTGEVRWKKVRPW